MVYAVGEEHSDVAGAGAGTRQGGGMSASSCGITIVVVSSEAWWALEGEGSHVGWQGR